MIDENTKKVINETGERLSKYLPKFYGKVTFNFFDGNYVNANIQMSFKADKESEGNNEIV